MIKPKNGFLPVSERCCLRVNAVTRIYRHDVPNLEVELSTTEGGDYLVISAEGSYAEAWLQFCGLAPDEEKRGDCG